MSRTILIALALPLFSVPACGQTAPNDFQILQSLLTEVRQLRQDLRTTTLTAQRAQILIYRVQAQEAVVRRSKERVDENHSKLAQIRFEQKRVAARLKEVQDALERSETSSTEHKDLEQILLQRKAELEIQTNSEQETQPKVTEAEEQLSLEQARLGTLQEELDRLDKALENSSANSGIKPQ